MTYESNASTLEEFPQLSLSETPKLLATNRSNVNMQTTNRCTLQFGCGCCVGDDRGREIQTCN
eukprot:m.96702 g.96702  ORF g.96702 m.96702 type:complete len:63 (+) comp26915_c0_seq1:214-402(+)